MSELTVVDVLVQQEGKNPSFFAYMDYTEAKRIEAIGLQNAYPIHLRNSDERPLPKSLLAGETLVHDVFVKMEPNVPICLN